MLWLYVFYTSVMDGAYFRLHALGGVVDSVDYKDDDDNDEGGIDTYFTLLHA